jgi:poly-gamma-glutamate capsule biosynthesis protein CapA/YwtB (metallophosphatase superfamily)
MVMASSTGQGLSVALVGDLNLGTPINPDNVLDLIKMDFGVFDVKFCNLEGCLFDPNVLLEHKPGWRHCDQAHVQVLGELKLNAAACANNVHFGEAAIKHSLSLLDKHNIAHAGAGINRNEARRPAIFEWKDTTFGLLSYTSVYWPIGQAAGEKSAGVATVKVYTSYEPHRRLFEMPGAPATTLTHPDEKECEEIKNDIIELRKKVDVLVVYFHWGVSGHYEVCQYQTILGRLAINAGADLVVGSHPHVVQAVEIYKGKPIFYSLGNFLFGSDFKPARGYRNGLVAIAEVENREVVRVSIVPSAINEGEQPALLGPDQSETVALMDNVKRLSSVFGTQFICHGDRVLVTAT